MESYKPNLEIEVLRPGNSRQFTAKPTLSIFKSGFMLCNSKACAMLGLKEGTSISLGRNADGWYLVTGKDAENTFTVRMNKFKGGGFNSALIVSQVFKWYACEHNLITSEVDAIKTMRFLVLEKEIKHGVHGLVNCMALKPREYKKVNNSIGCDVIGSDAMGFDWI